MASSSGELSFKDCDAWAVSKLSAPTLTMVWSLENYLQTSSRGPLSAVKSPIFVGKPGVKSKWQFQVKCRPHRDNRQDMLCVHLCLVELDHQDSTTPAPSSLSANFRLCLFNPTTGMEFEGAGRTIESCTFRVGFGWGYDGLIPMATLRDPNSPIVSEGRVMFKCQMWLGEKNVVHRQGAGGVAHDHRHLKTHTSQAVRLSFDIGRLVRDTTSSDVTIHTAATATTSSKSFPAHKAVLAARSSVFRGMFSNANFTESVKGSVEISDFDGDVVELMLDFLYTADVKTERATLVAPDLFRIAHKYDIPDLVELTEDLIVDHISVENAMDILALGHMYQSTFILDCVADIINKNKSEVKKTSGFRRVSETCPGAIVDLFLAEF